MKKIFTLVLSLLTLGAISQSTTVVISQFYGGGGSTSPTVTYTNDYAELHNVSNVSQDISGFSLQYGSATGNFGNSATAIFTFPAGTIIPSGKYYLVQLGAAGTGGGPLPVAPDQASTNVSASSSSGKVALVNNATPLGCGATATPCVLVGSATIVDVVAYGVANNAEGGASANGGAALSSNQQGLVRKILGCQDTDNNNTDFDVVTNPVPRNSATTAVNCSALPLSITSFKAVFAGGKSSVTWTTSNEVNVKGFSVEKGLNAVKFSEIGFVNANNQSSNAYTIVDENVKSGANYYRLKMIDMDGSFHYSNIVSVNGKSDIFVDVFPNPVVNSITVRHEKALNKATIAIVGMDGRQLKSVPIAAGATQTAFVLAELVKGNYMLIYNNNGERSVVRFTKQ